MNDNTKEALSILFMCTTFFVLGLLFRFDYSNRITPDYTQGAGYIIQWDTLDTSFTIFYNNTTVNKNYE